MNQAPKALKTVKDFSQALAAFRKAATSQRQRLHELLCASMEFIQDDWNTKPVSDLVKVVQELRHFNSKAIMSWIYFSTGGSVTNDGKISIVPKHSCLRFNAEKCTFTVAALSSGKKGETSKEEIQALQAERVKMLHDAIQKAKAVPFWLFAPEKVEQPYNLSSLLHALKRAQDNQEHLTEQDRTFVRDLLRTCDTYGKELRKGNKDSDKA